MCPVSNATKIIYYKKLKIENCKFILYFYYFKWKRYELVHLEELNVPAIK